MSIISETRKYVVKTYRAEILFESVKIIKNKTHVFLETVEFNKHWCTQLFGWKIVGKSIFHSTIQQFHANLSLQTINWCSLWKRSNLHYLPHSAELWKITRTTVVGQRSCFTPRLHKYSRFVPTVSESHTLGNMVEERQRFSLHYCFICSFIIVVLFWQNDSLIFTKLNREQWWFDQ